MDSLSYSRGLSDNPVNTFKEITTVWSLKGGSRFNSAEVGALVDGAAASQGRCLLLFPDLDLRAESTQAGEVLSFSTPGVQTAAEDPWLTSANYSWPGSWIFYLGVREAWAPLHPKTDRCTGGWIHSAPGPVPLSLTPSGMSASWCWC